MKKLSVKSVFILTFFQINLVFSQVSLNKLAQSTMNFLVVGHSSKASSMGEAFTSTGLGVESIFYNPAGLTDMTGQFEAAVNYTTLIADINYLSGVLAYNLGDYGVVGLHVLTVDYGVIHATSLLTKDEQSFYPLGYKDLGEMSNVNAYSVGLSYAKAITNQFSIGGNVKIAGQNLGVSYLQSGAKDNNATKLVFDAGVLYKTGYKSFRFGMSLRNFSTHITREKIEEQLPLLFTLGAAINIMEVIDENIAKDNELTLATDFLHPNNYTERLNLGLEYKFMNMISIRGGFQTNRDVASWSVGGGFNTFVADYGVEVNYSFSKMKYFDNVNRISMLFSF